MTTDNTMPFQIQELDHVVLRVADINRARTFYEQVLGCTLERELPEFGLYQMRAGRQLIDLVPVGSKLGGELPVAEPHNLDHFCLTISPFDDAALRSHLDQFGITASETGERYGAGGYGPSIYIEDPDGNTIELKQFVTAN